MSTTTSPPFAAVDLGASSGRVVLGRIGPEGLETEEVHRFPNGPVRLPDGLHWNVLGLFQEIVTGLRLASGHRPVSVGVDSWAIDYGLLDAAGSLLGEPYHYRDQRTRDVARLVVEDVGAAALYRLNGLQFQQFNTLFQLAAARGSAPLRAANTLLLIPDLVNYWLTGKRGAEITNASTTGLLDALTLTWSLKLADVVGLDAGILPELRHPGERIGPLLPAVAEETGLPRAEVTAVASHDTASAVAAVPAETADFAYICTGTWSLAGLELPGPVLTDHARAANFTNEVGIDGSTRFLRNIMGLWLVQESLRTWRLPPSELPSLLDGAAGCEPFAAVIDANDPRFLTPGDIPERIRDHCRQTGQRPPETRAALVRCIIESLALAHRQAIRSAAEIAHRDVRVVHLVGGGARNELLCQLTADATGLPVIAGPVEATAVGNLLVQARAAGHVGELGEMRRLVAESHQLRRFEPRGDGARWDAVAARLG
ncbi:rhamnulokinase family protein [Saccharopolyspora taberi]|uniref:Rhamnulokinase family protein n=1 Tax=Saccharopolyspora taberi TaxID=60895 RepID=A0ABN3VAH5_9PSEU